MIFARSRTMFLIGLAAVVGCLAAADGEASRPTTAPARVHAMLVPQRMDDFAWENDRIAFRAYGPALQAKDGPQSGIDVWMKRTAKLVQAEWYADGRYHEDRGEGLDGYHVGATRGCGGTAVVRGERVFTTANFTAAHLVENGPDRVVFTLDYAPIECDGLRVTERKTVTLDAGSHFNRIESVWTFDAETLDVAVGVKLHPKGEVLSRGEGGIVAEWEPTDGTDNGHTSVAVVLSATRPIRVVERDGNLLAVTSVRSGEPLIYLAGGGWSKGGFDTREAWLACARAATLK